MRRRLLYASVPLAALLLVLILLRAFPRRSVGFPVHVASNTCHPDDYSLIVLRVGNEGTFWINSEPLDRARLAGLLADIYGLRAERVLYLSADDDVSFQQVAEVIDAVRNAQARRPYSAWVPEELRGPETYMLDIQVRLVTPGAVKMPCPKDSFNWVTEGFPMLDGAH